MTTPGHRRSAGRKDAVLTAIHRVALASVYFGVSFKSLLVAGVFGLIDGVPLSVQT